MQEPLRHSLRNLIGKESQIKQRIGSFEQGEHKESLANAGSENAPSSPLKLFPGISFSLLFRFLLVSRIYRGRMTLFCRKNYGLDPKLLIILTAASEGHLRQGALAAGLGINKNPMVFLIDKLELLRLIKRVANPDNRRERLIECTLKGRDVVTELKANYPEIVRWGLYPLSDPEIQQFGTLLAKIIAGEASPKPPVPIIHGKKAKRVPTPGVAS